jgi:hypothetical protein
MMAREPEKTREKKSGIGRDENPERQRISRVFLGRAFAPVIVSIGRGTM